MEDFNLPSPERTILLEPLQAVIDDVPPHFWAACQVCDIKALERLVKCGHEYPEMLRSFAQQTYAMAYYWGPSPPKVKSQPSTPPKLASSISGLPSSTPLAKKIEDSSTTLPRYQKARIRAEERDKSHCVLTGDPGVEVAHIYPYHSIKYKEEMYGQRHMFWNHLKSFWPAEKISTWEAELFPNGISEFGIEAVYNLITLSRNAHGYWAHGAFALKPISISDDKMTLEVQFFWQEKQKNTRSRISLLTRPSSTKGLEQNVGSRVDGAVLYNSGRIIRSGDCFKLQTDDPDAKPLPSFQLLELQWFLHRVQGMAGAPEVDWSFLDSDSDGEEIPDLALDEVGKF